MASDKGCVPASLQGEGRRGSRRHASLDIRDWAVARAQTRTDDSPHSFMAGLGPAIHGTRRTPCRFPWMPGTRACPQAARSADSWAGHKRIGGDWII